MSQESAGGGALESSMVYVSLPSVLHGGKLSQSGSLVNTDHALVSRVPSKSVLQELKRDDTRQQLVMINTEEDDTVEHDTINKG